MKKVLLFTLIVFFAAANLLAQSPVLKQNPQIKNLKRINHAKMFDPVSVSAVVATSQNELPAWLPQQKNTNIVSVIDIGTSANAYGYYAGTRTMVYYDKYLNAVTNIHRMGGTGDPGGYSGDLGFDVSLDGGQNFTNDVEFYVATENAGGTYYTDAARYPHGGIFNPSNSADPNDSYFVYFAPNLEGPNGGWGGYSYGVVNMGDMSYKTKNLQSSPAGVWQGLPSGFEITNDAVFVTDVNDNIGATVYENQIILQRGYWNVDTEDIEYEMDLIDHVTDAELGAPTDVKIAFAADGLTGYMSALSDDGSAEAISGFKGLYPVVFKTTDGGLSWEDLGGIQMAGPDGLPAIVNELLTDEMIAIFYEEPLPARDQIPYTTAFDHDIIVDANGNLHIAVLVGVTGSTAYSISSGVPYGMSVYDIYTTDGGTTWHAVRLGAVRMFRGTFGDISEDNRVQITKSDDGTTFFVSWNDTDLESVEDNSRPNVFVRGLKPNPWGTADLSCNSGAAEPTNATLFSAAMWNATFLSVSPNAREVDDKYYIPMAYQALTDGSDINPTQFKYIQDFYFTDADFCVVGTGEIQAVDALQVSQNFPNPFSNETNISVSLAKGSQLNVEVFNLTGQKVMSRDLGYKPAGHTSFMLQAETLPTGVYFYTVQAGTEKITRKMIVR